MTPLKSIIFIILSVMVLSCTQTKSDIKDGEVRVMIDENDIRPSEQLKGNWEFYWNQLYTPQDFRSNKTIAPQYVKVPNSWTSYKDAKGNNYDEYGYATYRITVHETHQEDITGLFIPKIWCASKIWVNDSLVLERGSVTTSAEGFENLVLEKLVPVAPSQSIEIVVQVANYNLFLSGIVKPFIVGKYETLLNSQTLHGLRNVMWIGAVLIMGIYHFVLFYFRQKTRTPLLFGIICLLIVVKSSVFGNHLLYEYLKTNVGWLNFNIQASLYYCSTYMLVAVGLFYIRELFPDETSKKLSKLLMIATSAYCLFVLVVQPEVFSPTIIPFQGLIIAGVLYIFYVIVMATIHRRKSSNFMMIGMGIMLLAGVNDGLHSLGIDLIGVQELIPASFGIFLIIQFTVIAKRFSSAFSQVKDLSINLEKKVIERTAEVVSQKEEIERKNQHITASINYAQRIQQAILPSKAKQDLVFNNHFVLFRPRDIVSGDFYYFDEIKTADQDIKFLAAIDCTGHGVPGAFMSMIGNTLLTKIIHDRDIYDPADILKALDDGVREALKQDETDNRDGMDASFVVFNNKTKELHFAGAANPLFIIQNGEKQLIKGDKHHIGGLHDDADFTFKCHSFKIDTPTTFYLFSDGYQDQFGGPMGKKFMTKKFRELLFEHHSKPFSEQKEIFNQTIVDWMGTKHNQIDDILLIGATIK